jgi:hypothetical protein
MLSITALFQQVPLRIVLQAMLRRSTKLRYVAGGLAATV